MTSVDERRSLQKREVPLDLSPETFRALGARVLDRVASHLDGIRSQPVTRGETVAEIRAALGGGALPRHGAEAGALLDRAADLLFEHSLLNGHPRFMGYITSSAAPIGTLAELLASSVNPNLGAWELSPLASEIELQTVRWIAELIGFPTTGGGLLVSGGNMANFVAFLAARRAKTPWDVRAKGIGGDGRRLTVYGSKETHTWIQKATDLFGLGTDSLRWIETDQALCIDTAKLRAAIAADRKAGHVPFLVVGTGGSVSTGAVDPLGELAAICRDEDLWFHVDGAYGALAAALPDAPADLKALSLADSVAVDPHKWLYAPIEAGCTLVRDTATLRDAFSYLPPYYAFGDGGGEAAPTNFVEYGPQNTRGFRALKVWLALQHAGREGYERMIGDDVELARALYALAEQHPELEARTHGLSVTTFRFVPRGLDRAGTGAEEYLDKLNAELLGRMKLGGEAFLTNAVVRGRFLLRACIVNFRTTLADVEMIPEIVVTLGRVVDAELRPATLK